ncbi:mucin-17 isoform X2 [Lingula anatina]|uniref:Mucin-17 isoform X2 n=1 Tax=Lingula anatina TaxID=7574 RepID=A0A1S3HAT5_LINAN|nr:mucin-17 isoform X2 [Lingula anatina]|eukprot:XP_013382566.1 mucin-17 isoform X2 [Lingula anatina]
MEAFEILLCVFSILGISERVHGIGVGQVELTLAVRNGDTFQYVFSEVQSSRPSDTVIEVRLSVTLPFTGQNVPFESNVTVSCGLTPDSAGYSQANFNDTFVDVDVNNTAFVPFIIIAAGRPASLQCWGVSSPILNATDPPQFSKATSISPPSTFVITRVATINFCSETIIVPNQESSVCTECKFLLQFSEPIQDNNVTISCTVSTVTDQRQLNISISDHTAVIGDTSIEVSYSILNPGIQINVVSPIDVTCTAQSEGSGWQYDRNTENATAQFQLDQGSVSLLPQYTHTEGTRLTALLALDVGVNGQVAFTCSVVTVNSTSVAKALAQENYCPVASPSTPGPVTTTTTTTPTTSAADAGTTQSNSTANSTAETTTPVMENTTISVTTTVNSTTVEANTTASSNMTTLTANTTEAPTTTTEIMNTTTANVTVGNATSEQTTAPTFAASISTTTSVNSTDNATSAVPVTTLPTTPPTTPVANVTNQWSISPTNPTFLSNEIVKEVIIERKVDPQVETQEVILVRCCAEDSSFRRFAGKTAELIATVTSSPLSAINGTLATTGANITVESTFPNPAYVELAPCPCDLTSGHCDTGCCCDSDCTSADIASFQCLPGVFGGSGGGVVDHSCASPRFDKEDWFPLMCVHQENSPLLGMFFQTEPALRTTTAFNTRVGSSKPNYTFEENDDQSIFETVPGLNPGYRQGDGIKTSSVLQGYLSIPQRSLSGECISSAPVQFLKDLDSSCVHHLTESLCQESSPLNARTYITSTRLTNPPCPQRPAILKSMNTEADVDTHYFCLEDLSAYVKSQQTLNDFYKPTQKYLFRELKTFDNTTGTNNFTYSEVIIEQNATDVGKAQRCVWDDGFTLPPIPEYNRTTNTCMNAVLKVTYDFYWQMGNIVNVSAVIVLGSISLEQVRRDNRTITNTVQIPESYETVNMTTEAPGVNQTLVNVTQPVNNTIPRREETYTVENTTTTTSATVLTQVFTVRFIHDYLDVNASTSDNETERLEFEDRSGNPGYDFMKPVLSGNPVYDPVLSDFSYVDANLSQALALWKPGPSGLCYHATRHTITFGEDATSSCILRLGLEELKNCSSLRELILTEQTKLMSAQYIATVGNPDRANLEDWVAVLRESIQFNASTVTTQLPSTTVEMTTAQQETTSIMDTTTSTTNMTENVTEEIHQYNLFDQVEGVCQSVPTGIHVVIMYAEVGRQDAVYIKQIVGAKVSYSLSTWQMDCLGASGPACANVSTEGLVQSFLLQSTVTFVKVPAAEPVQPIKYLAGINPSLCKGETCERQLLYPFTSAYQGDPIMYRVGFGLLVIFSSIGLIITLQPWIQKLVAAVHRSILFL